MAKWTPLSSPPAGWEETPGNVGVTTEELWETLYEIDAGVHPPGPSWVPGHWYMGDFQNNDAGSGWPDSSINLKALYPMFIPGGAGLEFGVHNNTAATSTGGAAYVEIKDLTGAPVAHVEVDLTSTGIRSAVVSGSIPAGWYLVGVTILSGWSVSGSIRQGNGPVYGPGAHPGAGVQWKWGFGYEATAAGGTYDLEAPDEQTVSNFIVFARQPVV